MSTNMQAKQAEFIVANGDSVMSLIETMNAKSINPKAMLYMNLCEEEFKEMEQAFLEFTRADFPDAKLAALADILDGAGDLVYVILGLCNTLGLPLGLAFDEIHRSNMNKFTRQEDGSYKAVRRADGKVQKPEGWTKPDIMAILRYRLVVGE